MTDRSPLPRWRVLRRLYAIAGVAALTAWLPGPVLATMQLERNIVYLLPGQPPRVDLRVVNPDEETLYAEVEVLEVHNPGTIEETRMPVQDPQAVDFLVTPNRFVIPPGGRKLVRFVNTGGHGEVERIFRVNLKPVVPDMEATQHAINLLVGYQVLVVIAPADPSPGLVIEREGSRLEVENKGNSNVLLRNGVQCVSEEDLEQKTDERCRGIKARRIYPGNVWQTDLPYDTPVEFTLSDGSGARRERF